jgi:dTDP-4-dehydrorhamnose 3,5-epimerase-like enzyme
MDCLEMMPLPTYEDERGVLTAVEKQPFEVKRAFWIYEASMPRGQHAHKRCEQLVIAVHGSFVVRAKNEGEITWELSRPDWGLYVPAGYWVEVYDFSEGAVCLVLCSEYYDSEDFERGDGE